MVTISAVPFTTIKRMEQVLELETSYREGMSFPENQRRRHGLVQFNLGLLDQSDCQLPSARADHNTLPVHPYAGTADHSVSGCITAVLVGREM